MPVTILLLRKLLCLLFIITGNVYQIAELDDSKCRYGVETHFNGMEDWVSFIILSIFGHTLYHVPTFSPMRAHSRSRAHTLAHVRTRLHVCTPSHVLKHACQRENDRSQGLSISES